MSDDITPQNVIDRARQIYPAANHIDLCCVTECSYQFMRLNTTGQEFNDAGYETHCRLLVQCGPRAVFYHTRETLAGLYDLLKSKVTHETEIQTRQTIEQ